MIKTKRIMENINWLLEGPTIFHKKIVCIRTLLIVACMISANDGHAQYYPYNPYIMNPGYQAGQQLGNAIAQRSKYGRNQLRKAINKWGECNNGTLSLGHGAVALYGGNGYFCSATVDNRISSKLKSINNSGGNIQDVNITENGNFIIIYNNGESWYGVLPSALKSALDDYTYGTKFKSVSFNESGTYAITTSDGFKSNNTIYQSFYDDNVNEYGELLSVNICGDGAVFCYSDGARYCGRIPNKVETAIRNFSNTARFVKFNKHGDYLICSKYGSYAYSIGDADTGSNASTVYFDYEKERKKKAKEKAYAIWDGHASYKFNEERKVHRVWCLGEMIDSKFISLETVISADYNAAPTLNIDVSLVSETDFDGILKTLPQDGINHMSLKLELANGETITSTETTIYRSWFGVGLRLSTSLVSMRSDKRSLSGNISSIKYLVGQYSLNNIKSITFKGKYTIDLSIMNTKTQLCYDFYRLADEAGMSKILPN